MADKLSMSLDDIVSNQKGSYGGGAPPAGGRGRGQKRGRANEGGGGGGGGGGSGTIRVARRVYVGNLSWRTSWQDLKDHFAQAGKVVYADVMKENEDPTRSKGCGIVEFETPEEAAIAIQTLNDVELNGRQVFVREDREDRDLKGYSGAGGGGGGGGGRGGYRAPDFQKGGGERFGGGGKRSKTGGKTAVAVGRRVYVSNLSWETTWQDLKDHFRNAGQVVFADVMKETGSDRSKGCGIVEFEAPEEALRAMAQLSNTTLHGRPILVREDREDKDLQSLGGLAPAGRGGGGPRGGGGGGGGSKQIVVQNLPFSVTWQTLKDLFRQAGTVVRADVMEDPQGRSRGFGTVLFNAANEASQAINMFQNATVDGRNITVKLDAFA